MRYGGWRRFSTTRWSLLAINAVLQIVWFTAAPLWASLMIVLNAVIIYQLTVNWSEEV
jgi:hypothetical protein